MGTGDWRPCLRVLGGADPAPPQEGECLLGAGCFSEPLSSAQTLLPTLRDPVPSLSPGVSHSPFSTERGWGPSPSLIRIHPAGWALLEPSRVRTPPPPGRPPGCSVGSVRFCFLILRLAAGSEGPERGGDGPRAPSSQRRRTSAPWALVQALSPCRLRTPVGSPADPGGQRAAFSWAVMPVRPHGPSVRPRLPPTFAEAPAWEPRGPSAC